MSGLAGVFAGHHGPGVYRWQAAFEPDDVRHTVEHASWRFGYVDGWTHQDKGSLLTSIASALSFPEHFGHNFDALLDCLRDLTGGTVLLWDGWGTLARSDRRAFDVATDVMRQRAEEDRANAFVVLLRGGGPEIDAPALDA